jgi:hypothetical protein
MEPLDQTVDYLATRIGAGDHDAFGCLYAILAPATLATVRDEVSDPEQAMHVLGGVFCEVWWMCALDVRCDNRRTDVASWVTAIAQRRRIERRATLDLLARIPVTDDQTAAFWTDFLHDRDEMTQLSLTKMLVQPDAAAWLPEPRHSPEFQETAVVPT